MPNSLSSPPPGLLPRLQDYEALWHLSKQIGDGGQGEIYETFPKPNNKHYLHEPQLTTDSQQSLFVTKIIQFDEAMRALQRIIKCYLFVHKQKLLNIYGIYHDANRKRILIVLQRLSHELDTQYLIDSSTIANLRFARPGYLYINSECSIRSFIKQIASQLNTIHERHRIHFDLKPSNIMFNAVTNKWCIIDYDLMKRTKCTSDAVPPNEIRIKQYRGTQSWTSPEMSTRSSGANPSVITNKTDIFSFGLIIIYVMECGYQPCLFEDKDIADVHCKELASSVTWRRDKVYYDKVLRNGNGNSFFQGYVDEMYADYVISDGLRDLLKSMLLFDVQKRLNVSQILKHPWLNP
eukprot:156433_1